MLGDGESAEGSNYEAAMFASHYKMDNLTAIIDCNRLGQSEPTAFEHQVEVYRKKWEAFGWHVEVINGHDMTEIVQAFDKAQSTKGQPTMIISKTFKGHGWESIENKVGYHGKALTPDQAKTAIENLEKTNPKVTSHQPSPFAARIPKDAMVDSHGSITVDIKNDPNVAQFALGKKIAVRKGTGYGLVALGRASKEVVALDADVKNSTFLEWFEKENPTRFFQCFIAEQNMVGVSSGLELRGKIPFCATFGAFFTRTFDQLRMAAIGRSAIRVIGTHCGVSIGADGPSQMALEDIGLFRSLPGSIVLYPGDGVSSYKLMPIAANYKGGISYIRATREDTPILYGLDEEFHLGGCKVLKQSDSDQALIIAAGITVVEALAAYDTLKAQGINVSLIDLYSVKPFDTKTVTEIAKKSKGRIITVEDHYRAGGIGETVASELVNEGLHFKILCVNELSRSGTCQELLEYAKIDRKTIIEAVKQLK